MKDRLKIGNRVSCLIEQVAPNYIVLSFRTAGNSYKGVLINENCSTVRRKIPKGFFPVKGILDQQTTDDFCNEITNRELDTTSKSTRSKKLKQSCIILDDYDLTKGIVPAEQPVNTVDSIGKSPIDSIRGLVESIDSDLSFPSSKALSPSKDKPTCIPLSTKQTLDVKSEFEQKLKDMRSDLQKRMAGFSFLNASSRLLKSPVKILNRVSSFHPSFDVFPAEEAFPSSEKKPDITGGKQVFESNPGLNTSLNINSNKPVENCSPKLLPSRNSKGMGNNSPKVASNSSPRGNSIRNLKKVKEKQKKITGKVNRPDDGTDTVKRGGRKRKYLEIKEQGDGVNQEKNYDKECSPPLKMRISAKGLEGEDELDNKESLLRRKRKRTKTKFSRKKHPRKNLKNSDTKNPDSAPPCNAVLNNTKRMPQVVKPKRIDPIQLALKNIKKYDRMRKNRNKINMLQMGKMQQKTSLRQKRNNRRNANKTLLDKTVTEGETKEARADEEHQDVPIKTKREAASKVNRCKLATDAQKPRVKNAVDSTDNVKSLTDDTAGVRDDDKPLSRYMRKKIQLQQRSLPKKDISHSTRSKKVDQVNHGVPEETNIEKSVSLEKPEKPLRRHMLKKTQHETERKEALSTHAMRKTNRNTSQPETFKEELDSSSQPDRNTNLLNAIQNIEEELVELHEQEGSAHRCNSAKASPQKISENVNETMKPNDLERPWSRYMLKKMQKQSVKHSTGDDSIQTKDLIRASRRFKSMKTQFKMEESPKKLEELHKGMIAGFDCDLVEAPTGQSAKKIESVKNTGISIVGNALTDNLTVNDNLTERNQLSKSWVTIKDFDGFDFVETKNDNFALPNDTESNSSAVTSCKESLFQTSYIDLLCHERSLPEDKNVKVNEAMSVCKPRKNRRKPMQVFKSLPNPAEEEKKRKQEQNELQERYKLENNANDTHNVDCYDRLLTNQKSVVESKGHNTRYRGTKSVLPALNMSPRKVRKPKQQKQTSDNVENAKRIISDTIMDNQRHQRNIFSKDEIGTPESSLPSSPLTPQSSTEDFNSILGVKLGSSTTSSEESSLKNIKNSKSTCNIDKSRNDLLVKKSKKKKSSLMETFKTLKPLTRCTNEIRTDDIVWGKCLGFGWWPGHVISLVKHKEETPVEEREAHVSWMGSNTRSVMQLKDLDLFLPQFRKRFVSAKKGMYFKAVSQAQSACKIKYGVINI
ncbi:uncharacterized protein LOC130645351 [Hydractinia symbiolongicarpus]|uniref:uncharacterized protein LOC130645351 n=1 Tax=Hydractinia symbiolongicarpus TaxID=13093 RepID=UPI00254EA038|nr:uncharacterized protein LOC130645351 [Hydractinia symbiolongicarpus]